MPMPRSLLRRRAPLGVLDYVVDRPGEIIDAGARNNDRVPAPVRFLGDPQEFTPVVLAELDVEMLPFDLQFPGLNEIIHVAKKPRSLGRSGSKREAVFSGSKRPRVGRVPTSDSFLKI